MKTGQSRLMKSGQTRVLLTEILQWLEAGALKPEKVYITHGEAVASDVMRKRIRDRFGWDVEVAELFGEVEI
jgi:metallo-beta-lactamase family protein